MKHRLRSLGLLCGAVMLVLAASGCAPKQIDAETMSAHIHVFHKHYNEGATEAIISGAAKSFKNSQDADSLEETLDELRQELGRFVELELVYAFEADWAFIPTVVSVATRSRFEHGRANEAFAFVQEGGRYRLTRYEVETVEDPD